MTVKEDKDQILVSSIISGDCTKLTEILGPMPIDSSFQNARYSFEPKPDITLPKFDNLTLLHIAAYADSFECFQILIETYNFPINAKSAESFLPIHYACKSSANEIAYYIIEHDQAQAKLTKLLLFTIQSHNAELLQFLLDHGASFNYELQDDREAFMYALNDENSECLKVIQKYNALLRNNNSRPLSFLCAQTQPQLVAQYFNVEDLSKFISIKQTLEPISLLSILAQRGPSSADIVKQILEKVTSRTFNLESKNEGEGVCHWACKLCSPQVADLMFSFGSPSLYRLNLAHQYGPSVMASSNALTTSQIITMLKYLANEKSFNFNKSNSYGPSVLQSFVMAVRPNPEVVKVLLNDCQATPNVKCYNPAPKFKNKTLFEICTSDNYHQEAIKTLFREWEQNQKNSQVFFSVE